MISSELESELVALSRAEKARLLHMLAEDLSNSWPGIEWTAGIVVGKMMKAFNAS